MSKPIGDVSPGEWAKHLRPWGKRQFWKAHRRSIAVEDLSYEDVQAIMNSEHPKSKKKKYGIELTYNFPWFGKPIIYKKWYTSKRARDNALKRRASNRTAKCIDR